jgi:hypothetical protein
MYRVASNRFSLPVDFGTFDTGFGVNDGTPGHRGGNGRALIRYAFRSYVFSTTFAPKAGRFLWVNGVNTANGVIDGLFDVTIQRVEIYTTAGVLVDVVKFDGAAAFKLEPGSKKWSDAIADLAPFASYKLAVWWTQYAAGQSYPAQPPSQLRGETARYHASTDLSLGAPDFAYAGTAAVGGDFGPALFAAEGGPDYAAALVLGDSIADSTSLSARLSGVRGDIGYIGIGLGDAENGGAINYWSCPRYAQSYVALYRDNLNNLGGKNLVDYVKACNDLLQVEPLYNVVICQHGRNSLGGNQTLDGMKLLLGASISKMRGLYPGMPWVSITTTPHTVVPANAAVVPGTIQADTGGASASGRTLRQWNDYLIGLAGGFVAGNPTPLPGISACVDAAAQARDPANDTNWKTFDFATTLLDAVAAGSTNVIRLVDAPAIGASLVFEDATASMEFGNRLFTVGGAARAARGGWTVIGVGGSRNSVADAVDAVRNGRLEKAHTAGATVKQVATHDALHPVHSVAMEMAAAVSAKKPEIVGVALAYTA